MAAPKHESSNREHKLEKFQYRLQVHWGLVDLTLELSGGEAVRLDDWLGAAWHQWNQKCMHRKHDTHANKHDKSRLPRVPEVQSQPDTNDKWNYRTHSEPSN